MNNSHIVTLIFGALWIVLRVLNPYETLGMFQRSVIILLLVADVTVFGILVQLEEMDSENK